MAIADDRHAVRNPAGIDVGPAVAHMAEHDSVEDMPGGESMDRADVFGEPCEILVSAGLQGQISGENVSRIQARIVAEAANGATSPEADSALFDNGVTVIPDLPCTAGGFVVGYFEWVQDLQSFFWTDAEVTAELERVMNDAVRAVMTRRAPPRRPAHGRPNGGRGPRGRGNHPARPLPQGRWQTSATRRARTTSPSSTGETGSTSTATG